MSPHRRLHSAAAQTVCLALQGRLDELADATEEAVDLVLEEGERTCTLASQAAGLVEVTGPHREDSWFRYRGIEMLRPFFGLDRTRERIDIADPPPGLVDAVHHLRAALQLAALGTTSRSSR